MSTPDTMLPLAPDEERVTDPLDKWSDAYAAAVVLRDFNAAENYRTQNQDWRWQNANQLYTAWVQQKYWEGTRIPRASIGVYTAFEQIESMLPKVMQALFSDNPWFEADAEIGSSPSDAARWQRVVMEQLDRVGVREVFRRVEKSALMYGNGIARLGWSVRQRQYRSWVPKLQPRVRHETLGNGQLVPVFTGYERVLNRETVTRLENAPILEYVPLTDFYVDPNTSSPDPASSPYRIQRKLVSIGDLEAMRGQAPFNIPSTSTLLDWAKRKTQTQGDNTKASIENFRLGSWQPVIDQSGNANNERIEVLEWESDDRIVWVAARETAILNMPNSYDRCTYFGSYYADLPERFYALSVCDVVAGEQLLQQALLNGRLDELALALHRPLIKKIGIKTPTYALRARPGQMWEAENPATDYKFMDIPNITASAYLETQASETRVQKTTGVTDLAVLGVPSGGGNSASRTATGVGVQAQASASRLQYLVENMESTFVEPILNMMVELNKLYPPIGTPDAEVIAMSKVRLFMRASSRMQSRMGLLQTFPLVFQTLANPALVSELAMQGVTPNWPEVMRVLTDMTGYNKRADLLRPMTPEERQQRQQQQGGEQQFRMQMQRERISGQQRIQAERLASEAELERERLAGVEQTEDNALLAKLAAAAIPHSA